MMEGGHEDWRRGYMAAGEGRSCVGVVTKKDRLAEEKAKEGNVKRKAMNDSLFLIS